MKLLVNWKICKFLHTKPENNDVSNLSKKYNYLFSQDETDLHTKEACFNITKESLKEFEKSNRNLKKISGENTIDIDEIKKEPSSINITNILSSFSSFQQEVLSELNNADYEIKGRNRKVRARIKH